MSTDHKQEAPLFSEVEAMTTSHSKTYIYTVPGGGQGNWNLEQNFDNPTLEETSSRNYVTNCENKADCDGHNHNYMPNKQYCPEWTYACSYTVKYHHIFTSNHINNQPLAVLSSR